jgi:hypothetical protein
MPMFLWDTSTGQNQVGERYGAVDAAFSGAGQSIPFPDPDFLLSRNGVVVRLEAVLSNHAPPPPPGAIEALTLNGLIELDRASSPSDLANLQLYDCSARCVPNTTVVAWTNLGNQRYAQVTG